MKSSTQSRKDANQKPVPEKRKNARRDADGLDLRESLFCRFYIALKGNGSHAAKAAGYSGDLSVRTAELLARPRIAVVINRERNEILSDLSADSKRVILELVRIAFLDPRKFFNEDGSLVPVPKLDAQAAAAIAGLDFKEGHIQKVRFSSKNQALQLLGLWLRLWEGDGKTKQQVDRLKELVDAMRGE